MLSQRQHVHLVQVDQQVEVGDGLQELLLPPGGQIAAECIEILQVAIDVAVLDGEWLALVVLGEGVNGLQRCGCGHVHQQILHGQGASHPLHLVAVQILLLEGARNQEGTAGYKWIYQDKPSQTWPSDLH